MSSLSYFQVAAALVGVLYVTRYIVTHVRTRSIRHLPGPRAGGWLAGNLPAVFRTENVGSAEFAWMAEYGSSVSMKGAFGRDVLLTADPKALQYILNTGGYNFPKTHQGIVTAAMVIGRGLAPAQGAEHARQRKIMIPAFSHSALRVFLPLFTRITQKIVANWKDLVSQSGDASCVIDMPPWLSRMSLDAIGAAGFDYDCGALDEAQSPLVAAYRHLAADLFFNRSDLTFAFEALWGFIPLGLINWIKALPSKQFKRIKAYQKVSGRVAKAILDTQIKIHEAGKEGGKDILSILIKANEAEDPKAALSEEEILSQVNTLMLAGHETTANSLGWALYELSRHPEFQTRVRQEIVTALARAAEKGKSELDITDLDSMKCLLALIKETLRYHPIAPLLQRDAGRDDLIPLSTPQATRTGEVITHIPVSKGQRLLLSIAAYNRLKSVWGDDADIWRPERFLEDNKQGQKIGLGVMANLATFGSGLRACIGWRFAVIEMQAVLIELLANFEFSPAPGNPEILRSFSGLMISMVKSNVGGASLPLTVTPIS